MTVESLGAPYRLSIVDIQYAHLRALGAAMRDRNEELVPFRNEEARAATRRGREAR